MFKYINFLLLAILLLIFSCDEEPKPVIAGCTIKTACNYNADATDDDDSCVIGVGCNQWCDGDDGEPLEFDCAGECGGDLLGTGIYECIDNPTINDSLSCVTNEYTWYNIGNDECDVCGGDGIADGACDCEGNEEDVCGVCGGTGIPFGKCDCDGTLEDCAGLCGGITTQEYCDACSSGVFDCAGICDGDLVEDCTGICGGSVVEDCAGECGGNAILSGCDNACNSTAVEDCAGECGGSLIIDVCGECGGGVDNIDECTGSGCMDVDNCNYNPDASYNDPDACMVEDCAGICGGNTVVDECGVCDGDGPEEYHDCDGNCLTALDCAGVCGGSLVKDDCDVCGGNNDCIGCNNWYMENFICDDSEVTNKCCEDNDNNNDNRCKINGTGNGCDFSLYCQEEYIMECDICNPGSGFGGWSPDPACNSYCDYGGAAVGDPCSSSSGSFTEGEGLCIRACDIITTSLNGGSCSDVTCSIYGEYCDYAGAEVGTPCSTSEGSFTEGTGLCVLNLSDNIYYPTGYITHYDTECADGTDSCCEEPACDEPATLSLEYIDANTIRINYSSTVPIYGFEFHIPGTIISSGSGGVAADNAWSVSTLAAGGDGVLGVDPFGGNPIPAGSGILTNLTVTIDASTENLCLTDLILAGDLTGDNEIVTCPEYWQLTCIPIP